MPKTVTQKRNHTKQIIVHELDLTKIDGDGDFTCPSCGVAISPEDETETVYIIIKEKIKNNTLEELVIQCKACATQIRITGFPALEMDTSKPK